MDILNVSGVSKCYGKGKASVQALKNISFTVEKGKFIGIMGASGSGKSTLLNLISTIDYATEGNIIINDTNITKLNIKKADKFRREKLGFIFQDFRLLDSLMISENIGMPLVIQKRKRDEIEKKVNEIMRILDIGRLAEKYPYQISGGEKQRTACARAIISEPELILADEPTGALDSNNARNIMILLKKINIELGATILMVTHDPMSASYCDKVIFLKDGRITNMLNREISDNNIFYEKIVKCNSKLHHVICQEKEDVQN